MIISYKYEFIFIKTRKTAGSSINKILRPYLGPNDIADGDFIDGLDSLNVTYLKDRNGHQPAKWISKYFPTEWQNFKKITVERNPWDKVVSAFYFYQKHKDKVKGLPDNITDFLRWNKRKWIPIDWNHYTDNDNICVEHIIQYDNLHLEFSNVMKEFNVPYQNELENTNVKSYGKKPGYIFNTDDDLLIKKLFKKEIEHFGYVKPSNNL